MTKTTSCCIKTYCSRCKKSSKQVSSSKIEIGGKVKANGKSSFSSKFFTKVPIKKAMDSNWSNILNNENDSISNVKKQQPSSIFVDGEAR